MVSALKTEADWVGVLKTSNVAVCLRDHKGAVIRDSWHPMDLG